MYRRMIIFLPLVFSLFLNAAYIFRPSLASGSSGIGGYSFFIIVVFLSYLGLVIQLGLILIKKSITLSEKIYLSLFCLIGIFYALVNYYFRLLESVNYPNFVYSHYHIYLPALNNYAIFSIIGTVITVNKVIQVKYRKKENSRLKVNYYNAASLIYVLFSLGIVLIDVPDLIIKDTTYIIKQFSLNPEPMQDMTKLSKQLKFVVKNTPDYSVIVHPDQSNKDPEIGNQPLIRYLLFPRTLIAESKLNSYIKGNPETRIFYWISSRSLNSSINYRYLLVKSDPASDIYVYEWKKP